MAASQEFDIQEILDAFDEWDICDAFMGLPLWWFNPTPEFGVVYG